MSKTDEERFAEWWASTRAWTPEEMAVIARHDHNLGPMAVAYLAGIESERARTRELVARIKALQARSLVSAGSYLGDAMQQDTDGDWLRRDEVSDVLEVFDA